MPGKKTRVHYKVQQLPEFVTSAVNVLLEGGYTYDDIAEVLSNLGHPVSKSSVARYGAHFVAKIERLQQSAGMARAIVESSDNTATQLEEAGTRLALDLVLQALAKIQDLDGEVDVLRLMEALSRLQSAGVQREKWKAELRAKAEAAAKDVERTATKAGLSPEAVEQIRAKILGISQ